MNSFPVISNITLSLSNISDEIYKLINFIQPDWNPSNTRLVTFTEGITNTILGLFDNRTPNDESTGLVIKLFGAHTELFIDRQHELDAMLNLAKDDVLSQRLLIQFNNGLIYEYAPGRACSREDVRKENIAKLIAIKLAQFHSVPIQNLDTPYFIILIRKFIQLINDDEKQKNGLFFFCYRKF